MLGAVASHAAGMGFCQGSNEPDAAAQDRLIQVADVLRAALYRSGHRAAIVARSGLSLQRLGQRYSHAGVALRDGTDTPWAVRQLYFDCNADKPRLFDQGLAGFVMGVNDAADIQVFALLLPPQAEAPLLQAATDDQMALSLLGSTYSASAHAYGLRYQNCNQWLAELLATAWASPLRARSQVPDGADLVNHARQQAQEQLWRQGYRPTEVNLKWQPLVSLARLSPWLHTDDHPPADAAAARFRVSLPEDVARWVRASHPGTDRIELCTTGQQVVLRRGWEPLGPGCEAMEGDDIHTLVTN